METTKTEYERRKSEVDKYIEATSLLDKGVCEIVCTDILGIQSKLAIDVELSRILKANTFLLLYNLIESTVTNTIKAIVNAVVTEGLTYEELSTNVKRLWIKHSVREIKNISQIFDKVQTLASKIADRELLTIGHECVNISGNIDAKKIREIAAQIGWSQSENGEDLLIIKNKRNHLAHGQFTFVDVGKDYTISELKQFKTNTERYLEDVLDKVDEFISQKKFKI